MFSFPCLNFLSIDVAHHQQQDLTFRLLFILLLLFQLQASV
jgi:hypothetical protein